MTIKSMHDIQTYAYHSNPYITFKPVHGTQTTCMTFKPHARMYTTARVHTRALSSTRTHAYKHASH